MKLFLAVAVALALLIPTAAPAAKKKKRLRVPPRSSTIRLISKDRVVLAVNRHGNSLGVLQVRDRKGDTAIKLAEVPVGRDPRALAVHPNGRVAFVTNGESGTVSVVSLVGNTQFTTVGEIRVGTEPRDCATTPNGKRLFVANHTDGTVSVIDTKMLSVVATVPLGGNPTAIAVTNDLDGNDDDETVFVTQFFSELIPWKQQPFDDARQGVVWAFPSGSYTPVTKITLSPLADIGPDFFSDRGKFCNLTTDPDPHSQIYCPDTTIADATNAKIMKDPQGAFPNQLMSALIRGSMVYLPNIGAGPEPEVKFSTNVQALVHVVDTGRLTEQANLHTNLNREVKEQNVMNPPPGSLDGLFGNDLVGIDADRAGNVFLIVSRGGNFVFKATADASGKLILHSSATAPIVRIKTGNVPNGVVISQDGHRAYVNNEVNMSVTVIDLDNNTFLDIDGHGLDNPIGTPPEPGSFEHAVLVGKLTFFTALGTPDNGLLAMPIREIVPINATNDNRGKASKDAWSGCASCHPDGLSDNVTWSFPDGPRQTIALDALFAKDNPADQRIANWSAVRGSVTDFNNNSILVQNGKGFAGDPANPNIYNHGITQGASDALDLMTRWVQTVRTLNMPSKTDADAGRVVFDKAHCASCHGGAKWTKSQVLYADNPAFTADPARGGVPRDPGVNLGVTVGGGQIKLYTVGAASITFLEDVGTFKLDDPIFGPLQIRGFGGARGQVGLGAAGFNVPSLLGVAYTAPYFHDGTAATLDDVFARHLLTEDGATNTIATLLPAADQTRLKDFLKTIDGRTVPFRSAGDDFRDLLAAGP